MKENLACSYCKKVLSRKDALMRHQKTCPQKRATELGQQLNNMEGVCTLNAQLSERVRQLEIEAEYREKLIGKELIFAPEKEEKMVDIEPVVYEDGAERAYAGRRRIRAREDLKEQIQVEMNQDLNISVNPSAEVVFNFINKAEMFGDKQVNIVLVNDKPWFKGKDIATILEYKKTEQAISEHVKIKNKVSLNQLLGPLEIRGLTHNETTSIYINEAGVYQLLMRSRQPIAETFQDWITSDLLPKIRASMRPRTIVSNGQVQLLQKQLEEERERTRQAQARELRLQDFIQSTQKLPKNEVIYIGSSRAYQAQNRYKIGGCVSEASLRSRFSSYNTGRASDDPFYCIKIYKVHSYSDIEKRTKTLLAGFKDSSSKEKEMYHINGTCCMTALDFITSGADDDVDWINEHLEMFTRDTINAEPVIFEPVSLEPVGAHLSLNYEDKSITLCDMTHWTDEQKEREVEDILAIYKERRQIQELAGHTINWTDLRDIIKERNRKAKVTPYRKFFQGKRLNIKWKEG